MTPTAARGRVLVALHETGYFRLYGSTIVELARRGWDVRLVFDAPGKRGASQVPAGAGASVVSLGATPSTPGRGTLTDFRLALDYFHYLDPAYRRATYLRRRAEKHLARRWRFLAAMPSVPRAVVRAGVALARLVERLVPVDPAVLAMVRETAPDVVLVSPLVTASPLGAAQTELVKAARALRIPVAVGVASWDHLTSKGLIRVVPDRVTVWNDAQRREAMDLHAIPSGRIVVTGAQPLDHWFEPNPPVDGCDLRRRLGLGDGEVLLLFAGSSSNMAPGQSEVEFVRRWLRAIRASSVPRLREAHVLVRPHPSNVKQWTGTTLDDARARVEPLAYSGMPLSDGEIDAFRAALTASDAVVGVNTTAMIEAAILSRPVLSVRDEAFAHSQRQTLHFAHLQAEQGGAAIVADGLEAHVAQLAAVLADPSAAQARCRAFVDRFVRPLGIGQRSTARLVDALEALATTGRRAAEPAGLTGHGGHDPAPASHAAGTPGASRRESEKSYG